MKLVCSALWRGCSLWLVTSLCLVLVGGQLLWQQEDRFDQVQQMIDRVDADNCRMRRLNDLFLPNDTVSHLPNSKTIVSNHVFPNRSHLVFLHNLALSRGYFYSFALQAHRRLTNLAGGSSEHDPGMMYYFLSVAADIASSPFVNSSAVYFATNTSYSPSFASNYNLTFPLFAPRAFRADDYNSQLHLERISTLNTIDVVDLGAISQDRQSLNYSSELYKINEWYRKWLPDQRHQKKTAYQVLVRYANDRNVTHRFNGPPAPEDTPGPVAWFRPYFDCARSNKWTTGAVSPIVDKYHRHTGFEHIEHPSYTAASVLEMDFDRIDINQCPAGLGHELPNAFANTARCPQPTTQCEPLDGFGFRRGGYECRCRPGYRLPRAVRRPFLGEMVERATETDLSQHFQCLPIGLQQEWISQKSEPMNQAKRALYMAQAEGNSAAAASAPRSDQGGTRQPSGSSVRSLVDFMRSVTADNCRQFNESDLRLRDSVLYGGKQQLQGHARMALRLANFISSFLQVSDPSEVFVGSRLPDPPLSEDQLVGEVLSLVMGDYRLLSAGLYWDRAQFPGRALFGLHAHADSGSSFTVDDTARLAKYGKVYLNDPLFRKVKARWSTNFESLEKIWLRMQFRSTARDSDMSLHKYTRYPTSYYAARLQDGEWSSPYFNCEGHKPSWQVTYAAPFFGWDDLKRGLQFKGVVSVSMKFDRLDLNQCDQDYFVPNQFKNTHKCDRRTSYCVPVLGRGFSSGSYKCECLQGYEFPFSGRPFNSFGGDMVELEYNNMVENKSSIFDYMSCRLAGANSHQSSWCLLILCQLLLAAAVATGRLPL